MVKLLAVLPLHRDDSSMATTQSNKDSAYFGICATSTTGRKQPSDNAWFRNMGRLEMKKFPFSRRDDARLHDLTGDDSTTPTRSTESTSFSSQGTDTCSLIPVLVSVNGAKKSCLKLYSQYQNDNSVNTIHYDHAETGAERNDSRKVSWDTVQFRTYETILGDNPSVSAGPPISLGWKYDAASSTVGSIDDYENRRGPRRSKEQFLLPLIARERGLMQAGYSRSEINHVVLVENQTIPSSQCPNRLVGSFGGESIAQGPQNAGNRPRGLTIFQ